MEVWAVSAVAHQPLVVEVEASGGVDSASRPAASASRAAAASAVAASNLRPLEEINRPSEDWEEEEEEAVA